MKKTVLLAMAVCFLSAPAMSMDAAKEKKIKKTTSFIVSLMFLKSDLHDDSKGMISQTMAMLKKELILAEEHAYFAVKQLEKENMASDVLNATSVIASWDCSKETINYGKAAQLLRNAMRRVDHAEKHLKELEGVDTMGNQEIEEEIGNYGIKINEARGAYEQLKIFTQKIENKIKKNCRNLYQDLEG